MKEKKKQIFLKTTYEGRMRAKQRKFEEELQRERQNQLEEERRLYVPSCPRRIFLLGCPPFFFP